jgi:spore coat protein A, manganese oxidase
MIHCHNLSHEDHDMMFQYQVGHHDIDCDSINSAPPKPLPAPELTPVLPADVQPIPPAPVSTSTTSTTTSTTDSSTTSEPVAPPVSDTTTTVSGGA